MKQQTWRHLALGSIAFAAAALAFSASAAAGVPSFKDAPAVKGDPEFCLDKTDGSYEHPDCRVRYACRRGLAAEVRCPAGEVFDVDKNPQDVPTQAYCSAPEAVAHVDCSGVNLVK